MKTLPIILVVLCASTPGLAQAPGWSRGQQSLAITYDECLARSQKALEAEGLRIDHAGGNFAVGQKGVHTAVIMCNPASDGKLAVNIVVASNGEGGGALRQQLQAHMERTAPARPPGGGGGGPPPPAYSGRYLTVRVSGRSAIVEWKNAPAFDKNGWVSIVSVGTPDSSHNSKWVYTEGTSSGKLEKTLDPGAYEVRFYATRGYDQIVDRVRFEVGAAAANASR